MGDDAVFNSLDGDVGEIADVEPGEGKKLDRKIGALVDETARGIQQMEIFLTADTWLNLVWIRFEMLGALKIAQLEMAEQAVHSRQAQIDGAGLVAFLEQCIAPAGDGAAIDETVRLDELKKMPQIASVDTHGLSVTAAFLHFCEKFLCLRPAQLHDAILSHCLSHDTPVLSLQIIVRWFYYSNTRLQIQESCCF